MVERTGGNCRYLTASHCDREGLNKALRIGASTEIAVVRDSARVQGVFIGAGLRRAQPLVGQSRRTDYATSQRNRAIDAGRYEQIGERAGDAGGEPGLIDPAGSRSVVASNRGIYNYSSPIWTNERGTGAAPQRRKHLALLRTSSPNVVPNDGDHARVAVRIAKLLKNPLRGMPLLSRSPFIRRLDLIDDPGNRVQLRARRGSISSQHWRQLTAARAAAPWPLSGRACRSPR